MVKHCLICGMPIKDGDSVLVGLVSTFVDIPSESTWAIEKTDKFVYINHTQCEDDLENKGPEGT